MAVRQPEDDSLLLILNPPNPPGAVSNKDTMGGLGQLYPAGAPCPFPPIDLPYAAGVLRTRGVAFEFSMRRYSVRGAIATQPTGSPAS